MFEQLPKDAVMMLGVVNTKLRDYYPSLDALCEDMQVDRHVIEERLAAIDYRYNEKKNQFE